MLGCSTSTPEDRAPVKVTQLAEGFQGDTEQGVTQPSHLMTSSTRQMGWIHMRLKHGSPSEEYWVEANKDAESKCREWGYVEAEVTGTNHFEVLM